MKKKITKFLIGTSGTNHSSLMEALEKAGITNKQFISEQGHVYLNTEGTLLSVELEENRYSGDSNHFYKLMFGEVELAMTNQKITDYHRYEIMHVTTESLSKLPASLLKSAQAADSKTVIASPLVKSIATVVGAKPSASLPENLSITPAVSNTK